MSYVSFIVPETVYEINFLNGKEQNRKENIIMYQMLVRLLFVETCTIVETRIWISKLEKQNKTKKPYSA